MTDFTNIYGCIPSGLLCCDNSRSCKQLVRPRQFYGAVPVRFLQMPLISVLYYLLSF
jgi:hypothetical protein